MLNNTVLCTVIKEESKTKSGLFTGAASKPYKRLRVIEATDIEEGEVVRVLSRSGVDMGPIDGVECVAVNAGEVLFIE